MRLLSRFEDVAERLFSGMFKKNNAKLQPVELAKELVRAMLKNKQVSISQVYVPNIYRVFLHSSDWSPLANFGETFLVELSKYVYAEGTRSGFTFLSKPSIELHADDTVKPREMLVEVDFDDELNVFWDEEDIEEKSPSEEDKAAWVEQTTILKGEERLDPSGPMWNSRKMLFILEIIQGEERGKRFNLEGEELYVGRHAQCSIPLNDPEVSRKHLKLSRGADGWFVDDLGSTNGTWVNGQRVTKQKLVPGDRLEIGQTVFLVRQEN